MKKYTTVNTVLMFLLLVMTSCTDKIYETFDANAPIYMSYEDLRSAIKMSPARDLNKPGKIYFKDQYLLINEMMKGIHVFDVSDPSNPQNKGFIEIPGNVDIAIKDNILYADSYVDLVSIDVSNFDNIVETGRVEMVFPYTLPPYDVKYPIARLDVDKGVVIGWELKTVRQEIEQRYYPIYYAYERSLSDANYSNGGIGGGNAGQTYGVGGSMARFGLYDNFLYIVNQNGLLAFELISDSEVKQLNSIYVNWNVETMYITDKHLFMGTQSGLIVYSLEVPGIPTFKGQFSHMTSCDPVVIKGDLAFVTLKGGTTCRGGILNQLDVVKMSNGYKNFELLKSYPLTGPQGLGIDGDLLFVCDGSAGLKIYNAADPLTISDHLLASFPSINAYDVIPVNNYLFMIGDGGFSLYDYSNIQDIKQIGMIPVVE